jgi:uncharacterized protein
MNEKSGIQMNPCLTCGACCAFFRASFYWREADDATPGGVPVELTQDLTSNYRCMKGTDDISPRCIALHGKIGECVSCEIYEHRSNPCRDFPFSWDHGVAHDRCDKARAKYGLTPLKREDVG